MKAILMSIKPKYVADILNGVKMFEIRKKFPKDYVGWVYIYCCKNKPNLYRHFKGEFLHLKETNKICLWNGKVVARFWCDKVEEIDKDNLDGEYWKEIEYWKDEACLTYEELCSYLKGKNGYAISITKLEIFNKPKEISEFFTTMRLHKPSYMLQKAPQSWCYIEI